MFYNFAKSSCLACSQMVACFTRYRCNTWSQAQRPYFKF